MSAVREGAQAHSASSEGRDGGGGDISATSTCSEPKLAGSSAICTRGTVESDASRTAAAADALSDAGASVAPLLLIELRSNVFNRL